MKLLRELLIYTERARDPSRDTEMISSWHQRFRQTVKGLLECKCRMFIILLLFVVPLLIGVRWKAPFCFKDKPISRIRHREVS